MNQCEKLKQEYEDLKILKQEFDLALDAENPQRAKELKTELEQKRDALREKLLREKLWPFENLPQKELKEQYESQREILERNGILEKFITGELGIKGIDNKEYVFPNFQEITRRMRENKEMLKTKIEQGFNQLLIVPFGMKLDDLIEKYKQVILKHYLTGKLLATKEEPTDPNEPLELDQNQPVWVWEKYNNADINGKLVYFPKKFSSIIHKGKTKQEILKEQGGFNVLFIEDLPNIPRQGKGKTIGKRKQIEAGQTPKQYLKTLKREPIYQNETGMTPEEQITYAIKYLEQFNQVIDDDSGKGSSSYQLGAFFPADDRVPYARWCRGGFWQAHLAGYVLEHSHFDSGIRTAVRV